MPQVQVLPAVPSFGQGLAQVLAEAGTSIGKGLMQRSAKREWDKLVSPQKMMPATGAEGQTTPEQGAPLGAGEAPQPQAQMGQSPFEQILNKPGGPSLQEITAISDKFHQAYPDVDQRLVSDYLMNYQKQSLKNEAEKNKEQRQFQNTLAQTRLKEDQGKRESINNRRQDFLSARTAIQSGETGPLSWNNFADLFGDAGSKLKDLSGARLDSAMKNLLVHGLTDVSAKGTNLWLEKVQKSALPATGRPESANETLITMGLAKLDLDEARLDIQDDLVQRYTQAGLPIPLNLEKLTNDLLKPYAQKIEDKLSYDTRVIYEREQGSAALKSFEKVPTGTPLTREKRDALIARYNGDKEKAWETAKRLGYTILEPSALEPMGARQ